jgi:ADP-ribosyl-[dinitrogen reductase] hydrolase
MASTIQGRARGALLGLAVGDALGAAVEFYPPGAFEPVTTYRAGGPHGLKPGEWTDDTSMALALADSIGRVGWDLQDQATRYVSWQRDGKYSVNGVLFDIGGTTAAALHQFRRTQDARTSGDPSRRTAGNGSIMRLAPVPIAFAGLFLHQINELVEKLIESSLPTHASPQCLSACAYLGVVLAGLIQGLDREEVLDPHWPALETLRGTHAFDEEVWEVALGSFRRKEPPEIVGSGYVVRSLEAALWAFAKATDFREAVLLAVNLGNDADTTGAICGQLAGAYWGEKGIPQPWCEGLARQDLIEPILERLLIAAEQGVTR